MGTWISHLRVAEQVLPALDGIDEAAFAFGNLAPDSGKPNETWSEFDPPKSVTHFLPPDSTEEDKIEDMRFYRAYLGEPASLSNEHYSFALGYFFHLVCDNLWSRKIWRPTKGVLGHWLREDQAAAVLAMKRDWYGLDFCYLDGHPASLFHRVVLTSPDPPCYLEFLSEEGLCWSLGYIRELYTNKPDRYQDPPYQYLNESTMARFVEEASDAMLKIHESLRNGAEPVTNSALSLLTDEELAPYEWPLGNQI